MRNEEEGFMHGKHGNVENVMVKDFKPEVNDFEENGKDFPTFFKGNLLCPKVCISEKEK